MTFIAITCKHFTLTPIYQAINNQAAKGDRQQPAAWRRQPHGRRSLAPKRLKTSALPLISIIAYVDGQTKQRCALNSLYLPPLLPLFTYYPSPPCAPLFYPSLSFSFFSPFSTPSPPSFHFYLPFSFPLLSFPPSHSISLAQDRSMHFWLFM